MRRRMFFIVVPSKDVPDGVITAKEFRGNFDLKKTMKRANYVFSGTVFCKYI